MESTTFATTVLSIVSVLVVGGVIASIKTAIDVAVIKQILKDGQGRMDRIEAEIAAIREDHSRKHKRHSERLDNLERPNSNGTLPPVR